MIKRAQNRIAESRATLPWTAVICLLIWLVGGVITRGWWLQMGVAALAMLMMALLNNVNALIRIYSRMISCSFIVLMTMTAYLWPQLSAGMAALAVTTFYLLLFQTYQDKRAMGMIFYAYAMLGIGSIFWVQLLWLVPLFWILMATNILAFSGRTFFASILGLVLPYWFLGGYYFLTGQITMLGAHFADILNVGPLFALGLLDLHHFVTIGFVFLLGILGMVHFLRNSYKDKIRIRMYYEAFIVIELVLMAAIIVFPKMADPLMALLIATTAPLIGHFLALTHTKVTNITFFVILAIVAALTLYNICL